MEFLSISNPVMQPTGILLTVINHLGESLPFLATSSDPEDYGREIYTRAVAGEFGEVSPYIAPAKTDDEKLFELRSRALSAITATDTVALRCLKNGVEFTVEWRAYYHSLLAIVRMDVWIDGANLPEKPAEYPAGS